LHLKDLISARYEYIPAQDLEAKGAVQIVAFILAMNTTMRAFLQRSFRFSKQSGPRNLAVSALGWMTAAPIALTLCDGKDNESEDWSARLQKVSDQLASTTGGKLQAAVDSGVPTQVSYGFVCGYCSGYAAKKAGKIAAVVFGAWTREKCWFCVNS
jgi:hypothetical protein